MILKTNGIQSTCLDLTLLNSDALRYSISDEVEKLKDFLGVEIHPEWLKSRELIELRYQQIIRNPDYQPWSLRAVILRDKGKMIGHIGFHSVPGAPYLNPYANNGVEFGFTIYPEFRRNGYAREASLALMNWAYEQNSVSEFILSIRPDNIPSLKLAEGLGFLKVGSQVDEVDGVEDIYKLNFSPT